MALYESLDREDLDAAVGSSGQSSRDGIVAVVRAVLVSFLLACWMAGAYAGIFYWSLEGSLLGVISSAIIAGFGLTFTWTLFTGLESR